ncbi:hypothetical protein PS865_04430 [Pseudomonas fluorescens]|uniref:SpaN/EivJ family type III secretion system needle length determinant n=1 Tax=Pseudomonas fluorescens TaxID=294 RepID=UPI00123FF6FF|nr:hypothetical protein [Pseudomonas fluorescens]VVP32384.1 hypothetical protein PS865_04430 [Pseudomonas fluorescens]
MTPITPNCSVMSTSIANPQMEKLPVDQRAKDEDPQEQAQELPQGVLALLAQLLPLRPDTKLKLAFTPSPVIAQALGQRVADPQDAKPAHGSKVRVHEPGSAAGVRAAAVLGDQHSASAGKPWSSTAPVAQAPVSSVSAFATRAAQVETAAILPGRKVAAVQASDKMLGIQSAGVITAPAMVPQTTLLDTQGVMGTQVTAKSSDQPHAAPMAHSRVTEPDRDVRTQVPAMFATAQQSVPLTDRADVSAARQPKMPNESVAAKLDIGVDKGTSASFLQVPFSKGQAVGQVIVNKLDGEPGLTLQLAPSSSEISSHLREGLSALSEPTWRLAEEDQGQDRDQREQGREDEPELAELSESVADLRRLRT